MNKPPLRRLFLFLKEITLKNFQQTPKQRRNTKNQVAKTKHQLVTSNPKHTFEHTYRDIGWFYKVNWVLTNKVHRVGKL